MSAGIFENKVFYLFGRFETPRKEIYELIESQGGKIQHDVEGESTPDYCIVQEYANSLNEYIQKVIDASIPILKIGFVLNSVQESEIQDEEEYAVEPKAIERSEFSDRRGRGRGGFRGDRRGGFRGGDRRGGFRGGDRRGGFRGERREGDFRGEGFKRDRDFSSDRGDFKRYRGDYEDRRDGGDRRRGGFRGNHDE